VKLLLAGVSTRAMADSAARAGFAVTAVDAFADRDQHASVRAVSLGGSFSAHAAARAAQAIDGDAVSYGANFENHPDAVALLAKGRTLWGNPPDVLRRVRDPKLLTETLRRRGFATPDVLEQPPLATHQSHQAPSPTHQSPQSPIPSRQSPQSPIPSPQSPRWLLKRYASGGGHGVRDWRGGIDVTRGSYLEELIDGAPGSIVFVASGGRAVPIGLTRQLVGDGAFGASGYRYCGNILTGAGEDDDVVDAARAVAVTTCEEFGLVGLNGIDLIVKDGAPYPIESNPRWCASMELVERAYGVSVFGMHAAACRDARLPDFDLARARRGAGATGKAVVFARRDVTIADTHQWEAERDIAGPDLRDVPVLNALIRAGQPVCTVFATGRDSRECRAELVRRAGRVFAALNGML
jgi:predicted ATP-grasp superfamily ATP-dependent carboligase